MANVKNFESAKEMRKALEAYPVELRPIIKVLFDVELQLSDGYGWYHGWDGTKGAGSLKAYDRAMVRIARRLKRASLKDTEREHG